MTFKVPAHCRVTNGPLATTHESGHNGAFFFRSSKQNTFLSCIASDGMNWEHVSVTAQDVAPGTTRVRRVRIPSWEEMCEVKDTFWDEEDRVVQYHPPKSEWVNCHPCVLHLWRPTEGELVHPPSILVGPKTSSYFDDLSRRPVDFWRLAGGDSGPAPVKISDPAVPIFVYGQDTPPAGPTLSPEWVVSALRERGCGIAFEPGVDIEQAAITFRVLAKMLHQAHAFPDLREKNLAIYEVLLDKKKQGQPLTKEESAALNRVIMDIGVMHPCGDPSCRHCIPEPEHP